MSATAVAHQWGAVAGFARSSRAVRRLANHQLGGPPLDKGDHVFFRDDFASIVAHVADPYPPPPPARTERVAALDVRSGRSKKAKDEKKAEKAEGKKPPVVSKQAKDAARKKAAASMRESVSKQGAAYDKMVRELDRDQYREYVLSVRHAPPDGGNDPEPVLSDWLPVCEVIVADRLQYEAKKFFKENGMEIPVTDQVGLSSEQIEGVPAIRAVIPTLADDIIAMAAAMGGSTARNVPVSELEFGVEDWGSFENAVDGLKAQAGAAVEKAKAAAILGVSVDDDLKDIKTVYRKLIATEHPDRNPDASIEKFNQIKAAYELMADRGGQSGATFEGLGDKAKRDFVKLNGAYSASAGGTDAKDPSKVTVALRSLTIYDRIKTVFTARNVSLQNRAAQAAKGKKTKPAAGDTSEVPEKEPVAV